MVMGSSISVGSHEQRNDVLTPQWVAVDDLKWYITLRKTHKANATLGKGKIYHANVLPEILNTVLGVCDMALVGIS